MKPAKLPDALIQDGPQRASMDLQCLRAKAGFTDTVSAMFASDIYTICLDCTQQSSVFSLGSLQHMPLTWCFKKGGATAIFNAVFFIN